jgi:glycosyltransferase involved in cell wall biosynthesis
MNDLTKRYKLAYTVSHPIQYLSPLFEEIAKHSTIELTALYFSDESIRKFKDHEFSREIKWDIPLLDGYKYKFIKNYSLKPTLFRHPFGLFNLGIILDLWRNNYDAVIAHGWDQVSLWMVYVTAMLKRMPILVRAETPLNQERLKSRWKFWIKSAFMRLLPKSTGFLAIGTENKEFYKACGIAEERIFFMPYAVDNARYTGKYEELKTEREKIRQQLGIPSDKTLILFCGKLIDKKNPADVIRAYENINANDKALVYVGDGALKCEMENYVKEKDLKDIYFPGFQNLAVELPRYFSIADIFVLPSTVGETWGLVVNVAMCFHLPVVVSDIVGCVRDLVKHKENGFVFQTGNTDELADYLKILINDPELRNKMGERSFEIIKHWDYHKDIEGMHKALTTIVSDV